jgi:hypothetical protein
VPIFIFSVPIPSNNRISSGSIVELKFDLIIILLSLYVSFRDDNGSRVFPSVEKELFQLIRGE